MTNLSTEMTLSFSGFDADDHALDFYDAAQAMLGFQRSIALTTHLILNDKIITQAPSLRGATIFARPPQPGSWEIIAAIIGGAGYIGTRPKDTPIGHLVHSAYDYVVKAITGKHVDYDKSLGQLYEQVRKETNVPILSANRLDSLIEKCEHAVLEMHRPIAKSGTAKSAKVYVHCDKSGRRALQYKLNEDSFRHIRETIRTEKPEFFDGRISSYNMNTYKGRVYLEDEQRPVPFELAPDARGPNTVGVLTRSLQFNARNAKEDAGVTLTALRNESSTGRLKGLYVIGMIRR